MADEDSGPSTDPFANAKSNLRDTVKWLATTLAALASVVLAGASITGISGVHGGTLIAALLAALVGLVCVFGAIGILLRLLTSESFYLAQLDNVEFATIKALLAAHADDILSPVFKNLDDFIALRKQAMDFLRRDIKTEQDQRDYDDALEFFPKIAESSLRLVSLAHLEVLRSNFKRSEPLLFALTVGAIIGIGAFAVLTGSGKSAAREPTASGILAFSPGHDWSGMGHAFVQTCGYAATIKAELIDQPQPGWVELRLLSPEACAGVRLEVPARLVVGLASVQN